MHLLYGSMLRSKYTNVRRQNVRLVAVATWYALGQVSHELVGSNATIVCKNQETSFNFKLTKT